MFSSFTKNTITKVIDYLLVDNSYFKDGEKSLCQVWVPMGTDPAPFMAELFLHHYEQQFIQNLANM